MSRLLLQKLALCVVLAAATLILQACDDKPQQQGGPPVVRFITIESRDLVVTTELPGRVSALMTSEVRPQVTGIVQARLFEEGADVEAGQVLYQIDPALFEAAYDRAGADLKKALANEVSARLLAERYGKIIGSNAVSRQEHDNAVSAYVQAKAAVEGARQQLETARINLEYTRVTAPVGGRISRSFVTPGALVIQGQAQSLAVIQHIDDVYVDVTQSSTIILRLRRALAGGSVAPMGTATAKVRLKLEDGSAYARPKRDARPGRDPDWLEGDLLFSDVTVDKSAGVVNIRARFDNPYKALLPGMYVRAVFDEGMIKDAILVPQRAVMYDMDGSAYVYVLQNDAEPSADSGVYTVSKRAVTTQDNYGTNWHITSGLAPGEKLLLEGHLKARPGSKVTGIPVAVQPKSAEISNAVHADREGAR